MNTQMNSFLQRLFGSLTGALLLAAGLTLWLSSTPALFAQSVEKAETSQDAKKQDDELAIARAAVAKPGEKAEKPETGHIVNGYAVRSSIELGYRFVGVGGNADSFRSQVNVREGARVLEYSLDSRNLEGRGMLYDALRVNVNNAGGDSSQTYSLGFDKARTYRFDANVRRFNYFRTPGPQFVLGWRDSDLRQQVSDYQLKLFPQRAVRVNFGFGQSMATGRFTFPYSFQTDFFPVLGKTRWGANDYRTGIEANVKRWNLNGEVLYRRFKNDPLLYNTANVQQGFNATNLLNNYATLSLFDREYPLRSRAIVTRGSAQGSVAERLHLVFRALHDDEFITTPFYEKAGGHGASQTQVIISQTLTGNGAVDRKSNNFDAGATYDVSKHVAINDSFRYSAYKIQGDTATSSVTVSQTGTNNPVTGTPSTTVAKNYITDYASYSNTLDVSFNYGRKFLANLGWRVMNRDVTVGGIYDQPSSQPSTTYPIIRDETESSTTHAFIGGVRWRPVKPVSMIFDVEKGESNAAFIRINPLQYTRFRVRTQIQATDKLSFIGTVTTIDRTNPTPQVKNDSNSRSYTGAANWEPNQRVWINIGYDYHNLNSTANIRYTLGSGASAVTYDGRLLAYSRLSSVFFNGRIGITNRLDLLMLYNYIKDRGAPGGLVLPLSNVPLASGDNIQALPMLRHNPEGRLAYRFNNKLTGNLSYRHFRYSETNLSRRLNADASATNVTFTTFDPGFMDYHAGIVTASVKITF
ncbi:MAG: hypothetical protein U0Y68_07570 [Blastocatellia bacterium]